jgi:UDP-glucose 4-epimerase
MPTSTVLVTGGAGYIGSHTCVELLAAGYEVVVLDDLSNSSPEALRRVESIAGRTLTFVEGSINDPSTLRSVFSRFPLSAVVHFAGSKAVGESVEKPLLYFQNNVAGTVTLLQEMKAANCKKLVFSSSATVYGEAKVVPLKEEMPLGANNPYGRTKLFIEEMCRDLAHSDPSWHIVLLRYFNPIGAHASGRIGEDPKGIPNNLMPYITQVAIGRHPHVRIFGTDYDTPDGTAIRDYIHVVDLAEGHVAALQKIEGLAGCTAINLGTGHGYSVRQMVDAVSKAVGKEIPYQNVPRRPGDSPVTYSDPSRARDLLGWTAKKTLDDMCRDSWNWQQNNPNGYHQI